MLFLGCAHGGEGKGSARHRPFTSQCGSAPFVRSALPMARPMLFLWGAHGARPARLLSAQPMAKRLLAIRGGAGAWPPPLKAPHWLGLWPVRSSFAVRAPCAHQRRGNASLTAKRFQKRAGHRQGRGKVCDHHSPFPRARTKGRGMLRTRQSASKDVPATGKGWERFARIARPFTAEGEAITNERLARSTALSQATGCERHIAEAHTFRSPRDVARAPSPSPLRRF